MSNTSDGWYDAVLKQMAAETYLEGIGISDLVRIKQALVEGNQFIGSESISLRRS
jgi:hypothetical protein